MKQILLFSLILFCSTSFSQNVNKVDTPDMLKNETRYEIIMPDILGLKTLKGDFHMHTIFSDGAIWPTERVTEAYRDGLDAIAITDHIEYRPHTKYLKGDLNSSYEIAKSDAENKGLLYVKAIEFTHDKPQGGHLNALFINDANIFDGKPLEEQINLAAKEGAYVIWNHPGWAIDSCIMFDPNKKWITESKIHAIEIFNEKEYYPRALSWCKDYNLGAVGCSDAHASIRELYADGYSRPITLIFAKDKTLNDLKTALKEGKSVAMFNGQLSGREDYLKAIFSESVKAELNSDKTITLKNTCSLPYHIKTDGIDIILKPLTSMRITLPEKYKGASKINVEVTNLHIYENKNLHTDIKL